MAKKKPQTWTAFGILNHVGTPWTFRCWDNEEDALIYIRDWSKHTGIKIPRHRVVEVEVTVTVKPKPAKS